MIKPTAVTCVLETVRCHHHHSNALATNLLCRIWFERGIAGFLDYIHWPCWNINNVDPWRPGSSFDTGGQHLHPASQVIKSGLSMIKLFIAFKWHIFYLFQIWLKGIFFQVFNTLINMVHCWMFVCVDRWCLWQMYVHYHCNNPKQWQTSSRISSRMTSVVLHAWKSLQQPCAWPGSGI